MQTSRTRLVATLVAALVVSLLPLSRAGAAVTYVVDGYVDASGIDVRIYRSTTGEDSGPFTLAQTVTSTGDGGFRTELAPGAYRATFNEFETSGVNSRLRQSADWKDYSTESPVFRVVDRRYSLNGTTLPYKADTLSGTFSSVCDNSIEPGYVEGYEADDPDPEHASRWTVPSYSRGFEVHPFAGPTKFRIVLPHHEPRWIGGDSFETATAYTLEPGSPATAPKTVVTKTFDTASAGSIAGTVRHFDSGEGIPGLTVRYYQSESGTPSGPWNLVGQSTTGEGATAATGRGRYSRDVPAGLYRITVNEVPDGSTLSRSYREAGYPRRDAPGDDGIADPGNICVDDERSGLSGPYVRYAGGTITGTVTDRRGRPVAGVTISLFRADTSGDASEAVRSVKSSYDGTYSIQAIAGPVTLQLTPGTKDVQSVPASLYLPEWLGDSVDAAHATTIDAADDETVTEDVVLGDAPLKVLAKPGVPGRVRVGVRLTGEPGHSSLSSTFPDEPRARQTYQWLRTTGSRTVPINGATKVSYRPTIRDLGHTLRLRVTYTPPKGFSGVEPVTVTSRPSKIVRTTSSVRASVKAGTKRFTVRARVGIKGRKNPSGTAYVQWAGLKAKGDRLVISGKIHTKKVRYRHGRLTYTVRTSRGGYWVYAVVVPETKTIVGSDTADYLKLK